MINRSALRFRSAPLAVASALVILLGCSSGDSPSATSTTAPGPTLATTTTEPSFSGAGSERFCSEDRAARERLNALNGTAPSADSIKDRYMATAQSLRSLSGVAPDEIAADLRLLVGAYDALIGGLERLAWDPTRVLGEVSEKLGTPEVKVASERLQAYERQACGIS